MGSRGRDSDLFFNHGYDKCGYGCQNQIPQLECLNAKQIYLVNYEVGFPIITKSRLVVANLIAHCEMEEYRSQLIKILSN
jgi:hypothetical protein